MEVRIAGARADSRLGDLDRFAKVLAAPGQNHDQVILGHNEVVTQLKRSSIGRFCFLDIPFGLLDHPPGHESLDRWAGLLRQSLDNLDGVVLVFTPSRSDRHDLPSLGQEQLFVEGIGLNQWRHFLDPLDGRVLIGDAERGQQQPHRAPLGRIFRQRPEQPDSLIDLSGDDQCPHVADDDRGMLVPIRQDAFQMWFGLRDGVCRVT